MKRAGAVDLANKITVTRAEAASVLSIGLNKLDKLVKERRIKSFVEDGTRLFYVRDLHEYADRRVAEDMATTEPKTAKIRHLHLVRDAA